MQRFTKMFVIYISLNWYGNNFPVRLNRLVVDTLVWTFYSLLNKVTVRREKCHPTRTHYSDPDESLLLFRNAAWLVEKSIRYKFPSLWFATAANRTRDHNRVGTCLSSSYCNTWKTGLPTWFLEKLLFLRLHFNLPEGITYVAAINYCLVIVYFECSSKCLVIYWLEVVFFSFRHVVICPSLRCCF